MHRSLLIKLCLPNGHNNLTFLLRNAFYMLYRIVMTVHILTSHYCQFIQILSYFGRYGRRASFSRNLPYWERPFEDMVVYHCSITCCCSSSKIIIQRKPRRCRQEEQSLCVSLPILLPKRSLFNKGQVDSTTTVGRVLIYGKEAVHMEG